MAERIKPFRLPETTPFSVYVHEHPAIRVIDEWGALLFGEVDPIGHPSRELDFYNIHVDFIEAEIDDSLQFYFAEKPDSTERLEDVALVVGTKKTGPRLTLEMKGRRNFIASDEVEYRYNPIWSKTNPDDSTVLIVSRRGFNETHILDNERNGGYPSPYSLTLGLTKNGEIVIIPH